MKFIDVKQNRENRMTDNFKKNKVFFAFSNKQMNSSLQELDLKIEDIVSIGLGGYMPKENVKEYKDENARIHELFKQEIAENNLKEAHIIHELYNHECFYTYTPEEAFPALTPYYSEEDILLAFHKELSNLNN